MLDAAGRPVTDSIRISITNYYEEGAALLKREIMKRRRLISTRPSRWKKDCRNPTGGLGISQLNLGDEAAAIAALSRSLNALDNTNVEFETDCDVLSGQSPHGLRGI